MSYTRKNLSARYIHCVTFVLSDNLENQRSFIEAYIEDDDGRSVCVSLVSAI